MDIHPSSIGIVTTTHYSDPTDDVQRVRAKLAHANIERAADMGFSVTVIDGGSDSALLDLRRLTELGVAVEQRTSAERVKDRQDAARRAIELNPLLEFLVWTEPEKDITPWAVDWARLARVEQAEVVLPMRMAMDSYPLLMQLLEVSCNEAVSAMFGRDMGDQLFGPRLFTVSAAEKHWLRPYEQYGTAIRQWGSIVCPVLSAIAATDRVVGIGVPFDYPAEQCIVETGHQATESKRRLQQQTLMQLFEDVRSHLNMTDTSSFELLGGFSLAMQTATPLSLTDWHSALASPHS